MADVQKENKILQDTLIKKVVGCKLYRRDIAADAARFLVEYGNKLNAEVCCTNDSVGCLGVWLRFEFGLATGCWVH